MRRPQRPAAVFPAPVRLHSWYSETEEEDGEDEEDRVAVSADGARPLPDEISVNNVLDGVAGWSAEEDGDQDSMGEQRPPPAPPETELPAPEMVSAAVSPDRCSQVRRRPAGVTPVPHRTRQRCSDPVCDRPSL